VLFGTTMMLATRRDLRYNTGVMVLAVFRSPRNRRRGLWAAGVLVAAGAFVLANQLLPRGGEPPNVFERGRVQIVRVPQKVPLTTERRRTIAALLDAFVPAAVERKDPMRAYPLVTPAFRAGVTRAQWRHGDLPVIPYDADGRYNGWTLGYSLKDEMSVDLLLRPGAREKRGAVAFTAVFKKRHDRWLIDAFIPAATFAPDDADTSRILAHPDFSPSVKGGAAVAGGGTG
jgi:hypothetical protein